ncbi:unnamed protein product, partial [Rotaria sp. Silwood2]
MQIYLNRLIQNQYFQLILHLISPLVDILLFMFTIIFHIIKRICFEVYLLFTRLPPTQAWMDLREQELVVKYIQKLKRER